ncbi:MAG: sulfotransferase family protein [Nocardiopsaceae bacterium]|nr:sulfotransferase family protein [Nocardiopsaceae bacterium]
MRLMMWSAPRGRSTAFFRMMAERGDFTVVHEPFSYLMMHGHADVGGIRATSGPDVIRALLELPGQVFAKETTGVRYPEFVTMPEFLSGVTHTFLIRDPRETIPSYLRIEPDAAVERIGFELLHEIYTTVAERAGHVGRQPVVVDAADLARDPEGTVRAYCAAVGIPFVRDALSWEPAHRPEWQPSRRWHETVAASTGLGPVPPVPPLTPASAAVPNALAARYLRRHLPYYEALRARRLTPA